MALSGISSRTRSRIYFALALAAPLALGVALGSRERRGTAARKSWRIYRRAGQCGPRCLPGELRCLPFARPQRQQRSPAAGRRQFHRHLA